MSNYFEKVKEYLLELEHEITQEDAAEGIVIVNDEQKGLCNMILDCEDEILIIEQHIMDLSPKLEVYQRLLQMNRTLVHGSFALDGEGGRILFRDTLQLANLDLNELEASLNALSLALIENADELLSWASAEMAKA